MNTDGFRGTTSTRKKRMGITQSEDDLIFPDPYGPKKKSDAASTPSATEDAIVDGDVQMVLKSSTPTIDRRETGDGRTSVAPSQIGTQRIKELSSRTKRLSANFSIDFAKTPSGSTSSIAGKGLVTQPQLKARSQGTAEPVASTSKPRFGTTPSAGTANRTPASSFATPLTKPALKGGRTDSRGRERPPASKAFEYVLRPEAVVRCSVSDALGMEREKDMAHDFFWMGRVPCRTVKLVGILVGVGCWEKRVVYTLDDGMGVIDCIVKVASTTSASGPPPPPRPIARVGAFVSIKGKLEPRFDTRVVNVDEISLCRTANEELEHVQQVRKLHLEYYDLDETFVIPPPAALPPPEPKTPRRSKAGTQAEGDDSETPTRNTMREPLPPISSPVSVAASVSSSPVRPSTPPQAKPEETRSLPARLRHPSRLHTGDLTENTFRIYIKHYIDHAHLVFDAPVPDAHTTPTKPRRTSPTDTHGPETPRPHSKDKDRERERENSPDEESQTLGLTLSFLRRVPELHLLAVRVVRAVSARQAREERKKLGEIVTIIDRSRSSVKEKTRKKERPPELPPDKLKARMKRLFQWALVQLLQDGSIILWEGAVRPCPAAEDINLDGDASMLLWKTHSTISSFSNTTNGTSTTMWDNDDDPSVLFPSPPPSPSKVDEAYASMTPDVLVPTVRSTVERLVKRKRKEGNPYAGAGLDEVTRSVVRGDDRFRWVLEWSVEDALKILQERGEVRKMKSGEWHWVGS